MMTVEENRKKVGRNNLFLAVLLCMTLAGVIGAVVYYRQLKSTKIDLQTASRQLTVTNDALTKQKNTLENLLDSISKIQYALDTMSKTRRNCDSIFKSQTKIANILQPVTNARDAARDFARAGYARLKEKNLTEAMIAFDKSEKAFNGYRDSYEIYILLRNNRDKLDDPETKQQLLATIMQKYNSLKILRPADIK